MTTTHDTTGTLAVPEGYELRWVDPHDLVDNPSNRRTDQDRVRWAQSVAVLGILEPPLVYVMSDGRLGVIAGECRKYSAIEAGQEAIPVFVRNDLDQAGRLASIVVENRHREPLRPTVEACIVQELAGMEGMKEANVAQMTGIKRTELRTMLKVSASEVATAVGERHDLTLDQLLILAEFDQDTEAVKQLTVSALKDPTQFPHLVATFRRERDDREAYDAVVKTVTDAGVRLVELEGGGWLPDDATWLEYLLAPEGRKTMTEAAHRSCLGHAAAVIESDDGYEAAFLCLDPIGCGHVESAQDVKPSATVVTENKHQGMTDEQKAERNRVIKNNKAWETARPVRLAYVVELLARRTVPKGTLRFVVEDILADPDSLAKGDDADVAAVVGKEHTGFRYDRPFARSLVADATDARLPLVLLAQVAAATESRYANRKAWREAGPALVAYLRFLASTGYGLSEVEQEITGPDDAGEANETT